MERNALVLGPGPQHVYDITCGSNGAGFSWTESVILPADPDDGAGRHRDSASQIASGIGGEWPWARALRADPEAQGRKDPRK